MCEWLNVTNAVKCVEKTWMVLIKHRFIEILECGAYLIQQLITHLAHAPQNGFLLLGLRPLLCSQFNKRSSVSPTWIRD